MTHQSSLSISRLHTLHEKNTELPGNMAEQRNASHLDGRPAVHLEAKLLEAATQKWCPKLELYCSTLRVNLNCREWALLASLNRLNIRHLLQSWVTGACCPFRALVSSSDHLPEARAWERQG